MVAIIIQILSKYYNTEYILYVIVAQPNEKLTQEMALLSLRQGGKTSCFGILEDCLFCIFVLALYFKRGDLFFYNLDLLKYFQQSFTFG